MSRRSPIVSNFMTRLPTEIDLYDPVSRAGHVMRSEGIRHLPVMESVKLVGVISARDVDVVMAACGTETTLLVADVCSRSPYTVSPLESVSKVASEMLVQRVGSAVVVDGDVVVGIFTLTDSLRALIAAYSEA